MQLQSQRTVFWGNLTSVIVGTEVELLCLSKDGLSSLKHSLLAGVYNKEMASEAN